MRNEWHHHNNLALVWEPNHLNTTFHLLTVLNPFFFFFLRHKKIGTWSVKLQAYTFVFSIPCSENNDIFDTQNQVE